MSDWKDKAYSEYNKEHENEFYSDAVDEIVSWIEDDEEYRLDCLDLENDGDIESAVRETYTETSELMDIIEDYEIDMSIPYRLAVDTGDVLDIPIYSISDVSEEEVRIALESSNFITNYEGHEAILISPKGIQEEGYITDKGFDKDYEPDRDDITPAL